MIGLVDVLAAPVRAADRTARWITGRGSRRSCECGKARPDPAGTEAEAMRSLLHEVVAQLNVVIVTPPNQVARLEDGYGNYVLLSPEAEGWLLRDEPRPDPADTEPRCNRCGGFGSVPWQNEAGADVAVLCPDCQFPDDARAALIREQETDR